MLAQCPSCRRHVRATERACPFCATAFDAPLVVRDNPVRGRMSRAAAIALASGMAAAGCSSSEPLYGAPEPAGDAAIYGAPADARADTGVAGDSGGLLDVAVYGAPSDTDP